MKFKSKKGLITGLIFWSVSLFMVAISVKVLVYNPSKWIALMSILPAFFMMLTWFDTHYIIEDKLLRYKSGLVNGSIKIETINTITNKKTMYVGLKPALSSKGCIINYNKWDDIYLSPENQELFNLELLKINPDIKIVNA